MDQASVAFTGGIPEIYDRIFVPIIFEEYAKDLVGRLSVPEGGKVLEIASGTGAVTKHLREQLSKTVEIVASDLNPAMLEVAKSKFSDQDNIVFQTEDAHKLSFPDDSFDAIISQFSIMFFPDKLASLIEAKRVLKPGGTYIFNVWDSFEHNFLAETVNETIVQMSPNNPIRFFEVPYCYFEIDEIKKILGEAGFGDIIISVLPRFSPSPTAKIAANAFIKGSPISLQINEYEGLELDDAIDAVEKAITSKFGAENISAKMQAIVFEAKLPG